ncbi:SAM-dependent methyltransferase [Streptococcus mutans 5SM3]|uniref:class I SAM-dependent methyltransferase n=1 Tax=Streptococcus mutans TaxID=1309 RepID=UPI0002B5B497|nr:class I SAM-dependent methyltransferase [Streptococcus mutans]EMB78920.1 SAM-dependent methyltransferase [Streptococcus mutans 5SM3]MCB4978452.1 methyltransferase domain-containing protein [Streptococcus mutans]
MTKKEVGHNFLARLGKKRLRPGGITATNWLIESGLDELVHVQQANAMKLPFPDDSFDIIINEAKIKAIKEYLRVLKPGGRLLTHDVSFTEERMEEQLASLRQTINANVEPLHVADWQKLFEEQGFSSVKLNYGKLTLMFILGMIKDEGFWGTLRITYRGLKKENRQQFLKMYRFFNKAGKDLTYIAVCSTK